MDIQQSGNNKLTLFLSVCPAPPPPPVSFFSLPLSLFPPLSLVIMATTSGHSPEVCVVLTEQDIPGAALNYDRLETCTVAALRWWLLCRGISVRTSLKKAQVIAK